MMDKSFLFGCGGQVSLFVSIYSSVASSGPSSRMERPPPSHVIHKELPVAAEESGEYFRGPPRLPSGVPGGHCEAEVAVRPQMSA
jgi:hypothetical protein